MHRYLINAASLTLTIFAVSMGSISHAATMDDYVTCSLVYGALFQAAKNAQHDGMLSYAYYFDSGDSNSVREMGLFYAEIPRKA